MRIHTFPVTCDICGGDGMGTIQTAAAQWDTRCEVRHTDPAVCAVVLREECRKLDAIRERTTDA